MIDMLSWLRRWRKHEHIAGQAVAEADVDTANGKGAKPRSHVIVAVPCAPLKADKLNVPGEYDRLRQALLTVTPGLTLARARPATLQRLSEMAAHYSPVIVHFIGHGSTKEDGIPVLQFEKEDGDVCYVDAKTMANSLKGHTTLVVLNACSTAQKPDTPTEEDSFAQTLISIPSPKISAKN